MVVDHRGKQVMGSANGMHITGEMKIYLRHRRDLGAAAAGCTPLGAKAWSKTWLTEANGGAQALPAQRVP
jgi:hypothetical protein